MPAAPVLDGDSNRSGGKRERIYDYWLLRDTGAVTAADAAVQQLMLMMIDNGAYTYTGH
jgi:hypothetical protein